VIGDPIAFVFWLIVVYFFGQLRGTASLRRDIKENEIRNLRNRMVEIADLLRDTHSDDEIWRVIRERYSDPLFFSEYGSAIDLIKAEFPDFPYLSQRLTP
jgi:hypothetical protein